MKFLDTNYLLDYIDNLESNEEKFAISSVTLEEIEHIKSSKSKTEEVCYQARLVARWLQNNKKRFEVVIYTKEVEDLLLSYQLVISPDNKICACAKYYQDTVEEIEFFTGDLNCSAIAEYIFDLKVNNIIQKNVEDYKGFVEVVLDDSQMAYLYEHLNENIYNLHTNEYLIIKNKADEIVDTRKWNGNNFEAVSQKNLQSLYFNKVKPKDPYQICAIDSLLNNTITAISGKAGSGKSLLSLMTAMHLIEKGKYDRIVILFNPTKAKGTCDMGFYGGDFIEKAMQNSIGQILTTKFGDRYAVDLLMSQNKLKLVSMADCRGMEIADNEILWITEGQNTSVELIKLCLSRVSSGAKVFIEGDYNSQVDFHSFEGNKNGLKRMIDVFKNHEEFGYVQLQNVWRSKIAELCELL